MMTATTKPTAIPTIWFVLRPTDGGDGGKDAMGEDVARQVEEGVPITKGGKKPIWLPTGMTTLTDTFIMTHTTTHKSRQVLFVQS